MSSTVSLTDIIANFKKAPSEYHVVPFWFWNGDLELDELKVQMEEMKRQGVNEFFIHARQGLTVPYLSEEWFSKVGFTLELAQKTGMKVWIYDEENWPSGYAGGRVCEIDPDFRAKNLCLYKTEIMGPDTLVEEINGERRLVAGIAVDGDRAPILLEPLEDKAGQVIKWSIPAGEYSFYRFYQQYTDWWGTYSDHPYVDLMDEEAVCAFIATTHEEYRKRFGEYFGTVIQGFFTDEPGFYNNFWDRNRDTIAWSRGFLAYFAREKGYDLRPYLPCLWEDIGDFRRVRRDYYDTVSKKYTASFFQQIHDWCARNAVKFTGHLEYEEDLSHAIRMQGHFFRPFEYFDIPGIDKIDRERARITEKLGSSAAHIWGKKRCLSETYANSDWHLNLQEMKSVLDWQYVRGINYMNPHAFYYSIEGDRLRECPPSEFIQNHWWKYFGLYSEYAARLSYILSLGTHVAHVAVYHPLSSAWGAMRPDDAGAVEEIDLFLKGLSLLLLDRHYDFDYIDDDALQERTSVSNGELCLADEKYQALILPKIDHMPPGSVELMRDFAAQGGLIIAAACGPGPWDAMAAHVEEGFSPVVELLGKSIERDFAPDGFAPHLKYLLRRVGDFFIFFVINESEIEDSRCIRFRAAGTPYRLDPETGEMTPVLIYERRDGETVIPLCLPGQGSALIVFDPEETAGHVSGENHKITSCAVSSHRTELRLDGPWSVKLGEVEIGSHLGSWTEMGLPYHSGTIVYETTFALAEDISVNQYHLELGDVCDAVEVWLNGNHVSTRAWKPYSADITGSIRKGENQLKLLCTNTMANEFNHEERPSGILGPVKLICKDIVY